MVNNRVKDVLESVATWSKEEKELLLKKLSEENDSNNPENPQDKLDLLNKVCGAWKDTSENLAEDIINSRTISDKDIYKD